MAQIEVDCPYCECSTSAEIPDDAEIQGVKQSYRTGQWGPDELTEVSCPDGCHFGVRYT